MIPKKFIFFDPRSSYHGPPQTSVNVIRCFSEPFQFPLNGVLNWTVVKQKIKNMNTLCVCALNSHGFLVELKLFWRF